MPGIDLPAEGGCLCGHLRFRLTSPPAVTIACHCIGCQHMTASAFSLTAMVPETAFALVGSGGEPVLGALHRPDQHHHHCGRCLCWVYSTFEPSHGFVNVRATMLDDARWFTPFVETMAAEKLPWVDLPVRRSYPAWPPGEDFGAILSEYAAG